MKTSNFGRVVEAIVTLAFVTAGSSAFASSTWKFGTSAASCSAASAASGTCTAQVGSDSGAPSLTAAAVSSTASGPAFAAATLSQWSGGFGVTGAGEDPNSPQHSTDNSGYTDAIVLGFTGYTFDLDAIKIGWKQTDADVSVFRYTGTEFTPTPVGTNLTPAALNADGWELVGNYADLSTTSNRSVNLNDKTSSWWLISAYNATYGPAPDQGAASTLASTTVGLQGGNDYFKVLSVAGTATRKPTPPQGVPEPGSIALLGLGLVGMVAARRRKQASE